MERTEVKFNVQRYLHIPLAALFIGAAQTAQAQQQAAIPRVGILRSFRI
jgi:hypothetical protein